MSAADPRAVAARVPLVPASYVVLTREVDGRTEVALQLRHGTGYMDDWWACAAAGHVEAGESASAAAVSEAHEELGIIIDPADLEPLTTVQRHSLTGLPVEERADFFFRVRRWRGEPTLQELDKAIELRWFALEDLPERLVPHERQVLEALARGTVPALMHRGFDQRLTLVAAMGTNRVIGADGDMPWHLAEDLKRFKALTIGGTMIMGRGTWDSIGRALPGRTTMVVTRDPRWSAPGAVVVHSLAEALAAAPDAELFIVGGGEIYRQTIDLADRLELTLIDQAPEGDTFFPEVDSAVWRETAREERDGFAWVTYERPSAPAGFSSGSR